MCSSADTETVVCFFFGESPAGFCLFFFYFFFSNVPTLASARVQNTCRGSCACSAWMPHEEGPAWSLSPPAPNQTRSQSVQVWESYVYFICFLMKATLPFNWIVILDIVFPSWSQNEPTTFHNSVRSFPPSLQCTSYYVFNSIHFCLYDEVHVVLEVAVVVVVVVDTEAVRQDPHLHGSVGAAGEDMIGRSHLDLHDPRAQVPEQRLAGVFVGKGVEETLCGQTPDLRKSREDVTKVTV